MEGNMTRTGFDRREFLKAVGVGAGLLSTAAWAEPGGAGTAENRPNILVIMSDEHNASIMGCSGNEVVQTSHLDRLASGGVVFDDCYCNSPLCVPSRLSFTSCKYVSRVGGWSNSCWLPSEDYPSIAGVLNAAGYESFLCGKMHYDETRRYGFTEIGGAMNRGYKDGRGSRREPDDLTPAPGISQRFEEFRPGEDSSVLKHDKDVTAGTVAFLKNRKPEDKPFFLLTGYLAPHFPLIVPEKYWEGYKGRVAMPEIPEGYLDSLPRNYRHLRIGFNMEDVPEDIVRKGRELYYGLVQWVDEEIGKVLQALEEAGLAENTVVVYTADHGENMGEHGLWWKNCLYNSAARVPLIMRWPGRWPSGQHRAGACSLVDVVQTIADASGTAVPEDWDGTSMRKWLEDPAAKWKDLAVSEYYGHNIASGCAMIRMDSFKYVYHTRPAASYAPERELYDLGTDPGELKNLSGMPEHQERIAALHARLIEELGEDPEETELRCRADYARGYSRAAGGRDRHGRRDRG